jgi:uncharacterized phage protein (TIGR02220 family)
MKITVEGKALRDPRIKAMAARLGRPHRAVLGDFLFLWEYCYEHRATHVDPTMIDGIVEVPGFADAMLEFGMGEAKSDGRVYIAGAEEHIAWLLDLDEKRGHANEAKKAKRERANVDVPAGISHGKSRPESRGDVPSVSASDSVSASAIAQENQNPPIPPLQGGSRSRRKPKPSEPTPAERESARVVLAALGRHSGVAYRCAEPHVRLIARQLRAGVTELELRKVSWYCAIKKGWKGDPKWEQYLRPETLYGPESIAKYLDQAVAAFRKEFGSDEEEAAKKPQIALVQGARSPPLLTPPGAEQTFAEETA